PSNNTILLVQFTTSGAGGAGAGMDITGLTASDPDYPDEVAIYDISATGNRKVTVGKIGGLLHTAPGGRLSLTTNPTDDADVLLPTFYSVPYPHTLTILWDGTRWVALPFSTSPLALGTMIAATRPYDVFAYLSSGALALEMNAWTSTAAR